MYNVRLYGITHAGYVTVSRDYIVRLYDKAIVVEKA
jgi:hypothetical protein